jgi:PAS domain S-box-containing protein
MCAEPTKEYLARRVKELEEQLAEVRLQRFHIPHGDAVVVPEQFKPIFDRAQETVCKYFSDIRADPAEGTIEISDERYLLVRASALSYNFLLSIKNLYSDRGERESLAIGKNFLFDVSHLIGLNDARNFHAKMDLSDPIEKLSAGPLHFSHTGWALVDILPESRPSPDEDYFLTYHHPFSFEADAWIRAGQKTDTPICIMNAGYSSGWCEESFGLPLTAVEVKCRARGDDNCTFIMAPPHRIEGYLKEYIADLPDDSRGSTTYDIPTFFERKKTEEKMNFLSSITEQVSDAIVATDLDFRITYVNKAAEALYGYTPEELAGRDFASLYSEPDATTVCGEACWEIAGGRTWSGTISALRSDGGTFTAEMHISPMLDKDGNAISYISIQHDITERQKLERKIIEAQKMDSIGNLAGGVAHDFNNMLGGILGYASTMLLSEQDDKKRLYLQNMSDIAERASELTQKLLAFGRRGKNIVQPVSLNAVAEEVYAILKYSIDKSVTIELDLDDRLRAVNGDPTQMNQVLMNLCVNAAEAMPNGGMMTVQTGNVELDKQDVASRPGLGPGAYVKLTVKDTGYGMTDAIRERIFEPFFTTKHAGESRGTGLGLSTVYGIVKNHQGDVGVQSEPGRGSVFEVYFPTGGVLTEEAKITRPRGIEKAEGTVLLVEDEDFMRNTIGEMLEVIGYTVLTATDGMEGIDVYRKNHADTDAVILDMIMPRAGGKEAFLGMREIDPDVKAILCSGFARDGKAQEILDMGVRDFLQKPFKIEVLAEALKKLV